MTDMDMVGQLDVYTDEAEDDLRRNSIGRRLVRIAPINVVYIRDGRTMNVFAEEADHRWLIILLTSNESVQVEPNNAGPPNAPPKISRIIVQGTRPLPVPPLPKITLPS